MKTVVIDPGHGGHDPGALGPNGTRESDATLEVCKIAENFLRPFVRVKLTRRDDTFLTLSERPALSNKVSADVFVSYHFNSASSPDVPLSYEGFTSKGQNNSDKLADEILTIHGKLFPAQTLRADRSDGDIDKEANFAVIRKTRCPSFLMEGEFIHTKHGEASVLNKEHQRRRGLAVAIGVLNFFGITHDLGGKVEPVKLPVSDSDWKDELREIRDRIDDLLSS